MGEQRKDRGRFVAGLVVGLVIGAAGAGVGTAWYIKTAVSKSWIDAGAVWVRLPSQAPAGALPQTFTVPAKAYDYGATTRALSPIISENPSIVRVMLGAVSGGVGVSLDRPDGSALVSTERPITAKDSGKTLYFRVTGREGPIAVLVRNYAAEGQVGSVVVNSVAYIPRSGLSNAQLSEISKAGLN